LSRLRIVTELPPVKYAFRWGGGLVFKTVLNYPVQFREALDGAISRVEELEEAS